MGLIVLVVQSVTVLAASALPLGALVLHDPKTSTLENYSKLLHYLRTDQDVELDVKEVTDKSVQLFRNGVRVYQNVIVLPTKVRTLGDDLTAARFVEFVNDGGDVLVVSNPDGLSEAVRGFANQLGIYPSPRNHRLIDHFRAVAGDDVHKLIEITDDDLVPNAIVDKLEQGLTYEGSSALIKNNAHLIPILQAPTTSYTKDSKNDDSTENNWTVGKQGYLIVGHQALNNARSLWIGDDSLLQDSKFEAELVKNLIDWTFQIKNVLKVTNVSHAHADGVSYEERPYKIKDTVAYNITVSEWDGSKWVPYVTDDIQVDIKLLDPYHRLTLKPIDTTEDSTVYGVEFKLPDHHGVFSFHTDYKRAGWTFIDEKVILSIRHLANDEYPRSWEITNSWVYITSIVAVLASWIIFLLAFIFAKDKTTETDKKTK